MLPRVKKSYGQNFLADESVVKKIISAAGITPGETVLEIGPGTGVLTRALVEAGAKVIAVEADRELIPELKKEFGDRITLIQGDILSSVILSASAMPASGGKDHEVRDSSAPAAPQNDKTVRLLDDGRKYKLVANIPYNITSAVLEKFLTTEQRPTRMVLMVQREVADRITAKPPDMSLLSVVCQLYAHCERVAIVKAGAFRPIPKVDSAIVKFDFYKDGGLSERVIAIAKRGFASKRKQLKSNLGPNIVPILERMGLDPKIRAEGLFPEQWIELSLGIS